MQLVLFRFCTYVVNIDVRRMHLCNFRKLNTWSASFWKRKLTHSIELFRDTFWQRVSERHIVAPKSAYVEKTVMIIKPFGINLNFQYSNCRLHYGQSFLLWNYRLLQRGFFVIYRDIGRNHG